LNVKRKSYSERDVLLLAKRHQFNMSEQNSTILLVSKNAPR